MLQIKAQSVCCPVLLPCQTPSLFQRALHFSFSHFISQRTLFEFFCIGKTKKGRIKKARKKINQVAIFTDEFINKFFSSIITDEIFPSIITYGFTNRKNHQQLSTEAIDKIYEFLTISKSLVNLFYRQILYITNGFQLLLISILLVMIFLIMTCKLHTYICT